MKFVRCIVLCAALAVSNARAAAPEADKEHKDLLTLYMISLAADRCGFPMTARQSDTVDRAIKSLASQLKLTERQNDGVFSEADIALEKQGPKACDRDGSFAKLYKETLQKLTGP
jgi:hypothetical protein